MDVVMPLFLLTLLLLVVGVIVGAVVDGTQAIKAQEKEVACKVRQMDSYRKVFTANVTCVPYPMRQDTLTVK